MSIWPHCTSQSCMPAGSGKELPLLLPRCSGRETAQEDSGPREVSTLWMWDSSSSSIGAAPELQGQGRSHKTQEASKPAGEERFAGVQKQTQARVARRYEGNAATLSQCTAGTKRPTCGGAD